MKLPWKTILIQGPMIVEAARKLFAMTQQSAGNAEPIAEPPAGDAELLHRTLVTLERRQEEHARLLAELTRQAHDLATVVDILRARVRLALAVGAIGVVLAAVSLAVALWR